MRPALPHASSRNAMTIISRIWISLFNSIRNVGNFLSTTLILLLTSVSLTAGEWEIVDAYLERGLKAEKRFDFETARRSYDAAIYLYPKSRYAYYNRGGFYIRQGDCELALKDFNTALKLDPTWWWAANARGAIYGAMGRYDLALADYNKVLSLHPHGDIRATILNNRARIEATCPDSKFRNGKKALADAKQASSYGLWKATYLGTLATAYAEIGDFNAAIKYQKRAMAIVTEEDTLKEPEACLAGYEQHQPYREEPICPTETIKAHP